jgi:hypothetical protein
MISNRWRIWFQEISDLLGGSDTSWHLNLRSFWLCIIRPRWVSGPANGFRTPQSIYKKRESSPMFLKGSSFLNICTDKKHCPGPEWPKLKWSHCLKCFLGSAGHKTHRKVFDIERLCNLGSIFIIKKIIHWKIQRSKIFLYSPFNKP